MTNLEAIRAAVNFPIPLTAAQYNLASGLHGIVLTEDFETSNQTKIYAIAAQLLSSAMILNSFSEGGLSLGFNADGMQTYLEWLISMSGGLYVVPVANNRKVQNYQR